MSAEILRDLAMAKVAFQLRAIEAVIRGPARGSKPLVETACGLDAKHESRADRPRPKHITKPQTGG